MNDAHYATKYRTNTRTVRATDPPLLLYMRRQCNWWLYCEFDGNRFIVSWSVEGRHTRQRVSLPSPPTIDETKARPPARYGTSVQNWKGEPAGSKPCLRGDLSPHWKEDARQKDRAQYTWWCDISFILEESI